MVKLSQLITVSATSSALIFSLGAPDGLGQAGVKAATNAAQTVKQQLTGKPTSNLQALKWAIIGNESGGNSKAVNPHSLARGLGQVMDFNIAPWTKEALGYALTPQQFLNSPELQHKVLDFKLNQYMTYAEKKYPGDRKSQIMCVAATWYSGQCSLFTSTRPQYYGAGTYPSINHYALMAYERYIKLGGK